MGNREMPKYTAQIKLEKKALLQANLFYIY